MRNSFDRIRNSRTRRLTIDNLGSSPVTKLRAEIAMNRSKSVDLCKSEVLEILQDSFSETNQKRFNKAHQRASSVSVLANTNALANDDDDKQEEEEDEVVVEEEEEDEVVVEEEEEEERKRKMKKRMLTRKKHQKMTSLLLKLCRLQTQTEIYDFCQRMNL